LQGISSCLYKTLYKKSAGKLEIVLLGRSQSEIEKS